MADSTQNFQRVLGNVQTLVAKKAPEAEIDIYLRGEGFSRQRFMDSVQRFSKTGGQEPMLGPRVSTALQGLTFGTGDEIAAGLGAAYDLARGKGNTYSQRVAAERGQLADFAAENPGQAFGLEAAGSLPTMLVPGLNGAKAAQLAARMGGSRLAVETARGVAGGAAGGALYGAGQAEGGVGDRLGGAAKGAAVGATIGAAVPTAARGVTAGAQRVVDQVAGTPLQGAANVTLGNIPGVVKPGQFRADLKVLEAIGRDGSSITGLRQKLADAQRTGKPVSVADMAGENTRALADAAMTIPSRARNTAMQDLVDRAESAGGRISSDLSKAAGGGVDNVAMLDTLTQARAQAAAPLYAQAYAAGAGGITHPVVQKSLGLPAFREAYARAQRIAELEGRKLPEIYKLGKDAGGNVIVESVKVPDLQTLDYIKRGLDDVLFSGKRQGALGATELRALNERRRQFVDALDQAAPEYAQARAAYAGPTRLMEAAEAGREFLNLDPRLLKKAMAEFGSPSEREAYRVGAVDELRRRISQAPDGADVYKRVFGTNERRAQLRELIGDDTAFNELANSMSLERRMRLTNDTVRGNSRTQQRGQAIEDLRGNPTLLDAMIESNSPLQGALAYLRAGGQGVGGATAEGVIPTLLRQGDEAGSLADLARLAAANQKAERAGALRGRIGQGMVLPLTGASLLGPNPED